MEVSNNGGIKFKSDEIEGIIRARSGSTGIVNDKALADTEFVHRFLEHVCPERKYPKDRLAEFLWEGSGLLTGARIQVNDMNSHIRIALICLQSLTDVQNESARKLRTYAGEHLLDHLKGTVLPRVGHTKSAAHADIQLLAQAGQLLVQLFTEESGIDALFWTRAEHMSQHQWDKTEGKWLSGNRRRWLYTSEGVDELLRWFQNEDVTRDIAHHSMVHAFPAQGKSREQILLELLKPAAKRLAEHLLFEDIFTTREERTAVFFLNGYVSRASPALNYYPSVDDVLTITGFG